MDRGLPHPGKTVRPGDVAWSINLGRKSAGKPSFYFRYSGQFAQANIINLCNNEGLVEVATRSGHVFQAFATCTQVEQAKDLPPRQADLVWVASI